MPNHTSDQHPWFVESARSLDNAKRDWYVWRDPAPDGGPPNNWRSAFPAVGSAWTFDKTTAQCYLHSFTPQQPDLNWDNPEVEAAMHDVLRFWLDRGVDGFRIDVIHKIAKDPELRDNEPGPQHDEDWPTIHDRLRRIRAVIDKYDDRMIVGEVYLLDLKQLVEYINTGDELHLAHNFVFVHLPWQAAAFRASVQEFKALAEVSAWPAWFLENHDHSRVATRYAAEPGSGRAARGGSHADLLAARHAVPVLRARSSVCRTPRSRPTGSSTSTAGTRSGRRCRGGRRLRPARAPASPPASPGCRSSPTPDSSAWNRSSTIPGRRSRSSAG